MRRMVYGGTVVLALGGLGACGGGGDGGGGNTPVITIGKASLPNGDAQTGTVANVLPESLRVVVNQDNVPKAGATVVWASTAAGATLSPTSRVTDGNGLAATSWSLGSVSGAQTATATLSGATGSPVSFQATATPGSAVNLSLVAGNGQTAIQGGSFATLLRVLVTDQFTNPVPGVTVSYTSSGGIQVDSPNANTNVSGEAVVAATGAASPGAGGVTATVTGIATPVHFTLTTADAVREVTVGAATGNSTVFKSPRNNTSNPAVDTISVGQGVLWRWAGGRHSVESTGSPSFTSSTVTTTVGTLYTVTFGAAGTYQYDCAIHLTAMTGRVVVQ